MARDPGGIYSVLRSRRSVFSQDELAAFFGMVDQARVSALAERLAAYIYANLPLAIGRRNTLNDYRTNPYVLMTSASSMQLLDPTRFAEFLVDNKLYMGLETSFGKSIESIVIGEHPWTSDPIKDARDGLRAYLAKE